MISKAYLVFFTVVTSVSYCFTTSDNCTCHPVPNEFNREYSDVIPPECRKCHIFTYNYVESQDWAASICVSSNKASSSAPLFVVIRESLNVMSFQVPLVFPDVDPYQEVCRTLCPIGNYKDSKIKAGDQNISVEFTTGTSGSLDYTFTIKKIFNFMISDKEQFNVSISPSKPQVFQYNMGNDTRAVRIEATSSDRSCMVLAIQSIQCPIYDSVQSIETQGYYQTLTRQSGISLTYNTFPEGAQYVVLILKPTDKSCLEDGEFQPVDSKNRKKEVTVHVVRSITDEEFYSAIFGAFGFYVLLYIFSIIICVFLFVSHRRGDTETSAVNIENPSVQNYGSSSGSESDISHSRSLTEFSNNRISIDETDMDKLPDAEDDKNVVRTKVIVFVSDLSRKKEKYLIERSKVYSWNLLTIAIFYGLPVVQLVYINQRIVIMTGNQDVCYYNFLCSHKFSVFSDFNHVYSNIGYILLGALFVLLVWRRERFDLSYIKVQRHASNHSTEFTGIPRHFGLMYAMGWALIMEGVLSASYHVCPNRANFQFDTAFMYVIATVCMLKLYQSRHPDIAVKSHTTWMILAIVIIIGFGGAVNGGISIWIIFVFGHFMLTLLVSAKIYYMGRCKFDCLICKRVWQQIKLDFASGSFSPTYMGRFSVLFLAIVLNLSLDIYGLVYQPLNFGAFLLAVFIANLLMYILYYSIMKLRYKEKIGWIPSLYMVLSFICWGAALYFFLAKNTSWQVTPAESRERNKHCLILNFFDHHDIWHFLSSCALFFSFMVLFTLDDDLENMPRSRIVVF